MYKVFYNERTVFFVKDYKKFFKKNEGLFYKFKDKEQLNGLLNSFLEMKDFNQLFIYSKDIEYAFAEFCSSYVLIEAAGGLVRAPDNKILVIKRHGLWDLPKGKLEPNEKSKVCAIREVEEECGISNVKLLHQLETTYHLYKQEDTNILKKTIWYEMMYDGNEIPTPQTKENITEVKWIQKNKMNEFTQNTYSSIIEVLKKGKIIG